MRFRTLLLALLPALSLAETPPSNTTSFESLDRNADRRISRTEAGFKKTLANRFAYVDKNGDGFIDSDEYAMSERS
jgi:hypothetical protein